MRTRPEPRDPRGLGSYVDAPTAPYLLRMAAGWSWRILVVTVAVYALLRLVVTLRVVVLAFVAALLLAALLHPVHALLRKARLPSALAALVTLLLLLGVIGLAGTLLGSGIAGQFDELRRSVQTGFNQLTDYARQLGFDAGRIDQLRTQASDALSNRQGALVSGAVSTATVALEVVTGLVLALFTLFFLLKDGSSIWGWTTHLFSQRIRGQVHEAGRLGWFTLGGYMRGIVLVAAIDAVGIAIALVVLGVPLVVPLALVTFIGGFVPIAGAFVAGFLAVLVALVTEGPLVALLVFGAYVVVQQIEGNVLQPVIMRRAVQLHPLVTVLAVTAGATLAGVAGAVVAVPVAALINTVVGYLVQQKRLLRVVQEQTAASGADAVPAYSVLARMTGLPDEADERSETAEGRSVDTRRDAEAAASVSGRPADEAAGDADAFPGRAD